MWVGRIDSEKRGMPKDGSCSRMEGGNKLAVALVPDTSPDLSPSSSPRVSPAPAGPPAPASAGSQAVDTRVVGVALTASPMPAAAEDLFDQVSGLAAVFPDCPVLEIVSTGAPVMCSSFPGDSPSLQRILEPSQWPQEKTNRAGLFSVSFVQASP